MRMVVPLPEEPVLLPEGPDAVEGADHPPPHPSSRSVPQARTRVPVPLPEGPCLMRPLLSRAFLREHAPISRLVMVQPAVPQALMRVPVLLPKGPCLMPRLSSLAFLREHSPTGVASVVGHHHRQPHAGAHGNVPPVANASHSANRLPAECTS